MVVNKKIAGILLDDSLDDTTRVRMIEELEAIEADSFQNPYKLPSTATAQNASYDQNMSYMPDNMSYAPPAVAAFAGAQTPNQTPPSRIDASYAGAGGTGNIDVSGAGNIDVSGGGGIPNEPVAQETKGRRQVAGTRPQAATVPMSSGEQLPGLADLLSLQPSYYPARQGPAGYVPQQRVIEQAELPLVDDWGPSEVIPAAKPQKVYGNQFDDILGEIVNNPGMLPDDRKMYAEEVERRRAMSFTNDIKGILDNVGVTDETQQQVLISEARKQGGTRLPSGEKLIIDEKNNVFIGHDFQDQVNEIARFANVDPREAINRMGSSDGLLVPQPDGSSLLVRAKVGENGEPELILSSSQQIPHRVNVQRKAAQFVQARGDQLIEQTGRAKNARISQDRTNLKLAKESEDLETRVNAQRELIRINQEELKESEIDPQRFMKNASFANKLGQFVYMWAMGMAGGTEGFRLAVDDINGMINADIDSQIRSIDSKKEYNKFLKDELQGIAEDYTIREAQIKAVEAARLSKMQLALRIARRNAAAAAGKPFLEEEDYELQSALTELQLRQAEALKQADQFEAATTRRAEGWDSGYRPGGVAYDPLKRLGQAADVAGKIKSAYGIGEESANIPPIPMSLTVIDPKTGETMVAPSAEVANKANDTQRYKNIALGAVEDAARAYEDYQAKRLGYREYRTKLSSSRDSQIFALARIRSPEAVSEKGYEVGKTATSVQRSEWLSFLPKGTGDMINELFAEGTDPASLAPIVVDNINSLAEAAMPQLRTIEEARVINRQLNR